MLLQPPWAEETAQPGPALPFIPAPAVSATRREARAEATRVSSQFKCN